MSLFYRWTRDLHLYFGLFISPFLLLFSASVFFLNHSKVVPDAWTSIDTVENINVPEGVERAQGKDAIAPAQAILRQLGIAGEIGFTRFVRQTRHFVFPVSKPGLEISVDIDLTKRTATLSRRPTSVWEAMAYLHKMPGPHNVAIRGNWLTTQIWRVFADTTIYLTLFITISGTYLWWVLQAERRIGLMLLSAGCVTFFGLLYVVIR
jgi:hypothetical protein